MARSPLAPLLTLVTVAWLLILGESFTFFYIIRPTAPNIHESVLSAVLKISSVAVLAIVWIAVLWVLERYLVRSSQRRRREITGGVRDAYPEENKVMDLDGGNLCSASSGGLGGRTGISSTREL